LSTLDAHRVYATGFALWSIAVAAGAPTHGFLAPRPRGCRLAGESVAHPSYSRILASGA
jgi:hypothetical protein